jgi:hypothetical protein
MTKYKCPVCEKIINEDDCVGTSLGTIPLRAHYDCWKKFCIKNVCKIRVEMKKEKTEKDKLREIFYSKIKFHVPHFVANFYIHQFVYESTLVRIGLSEIYFDEMGNIDRYTLDRRGDNFIELKDSIEQVLNEQKC